MLIAKVSFRECLLNCVIVYVKRDVAIMDERKRRGQDARSRVT